MSDFDQFDEREFEGRLSREMQRVPAPEGFADRVMARAATQQRAGRLVMMPRRSAWIAIAAMLLIGISMGIGGLRWKQQQVQRERQQAEIVQRQFDLAMQVTQRTLAGVQERIGRAGEINAGESSKSKEQ